MCYAVRVHAVCLDMAGRFRHSGEAMVIVNESASLAEIDEALANVAATLRQVRNPEELLATVDALLDARLGVTCD